MSSSKRAGRQADQRHRAALAEHAERLAEGLPGHGRHQHALGTAAQLLDLGDRIRGQRIDRGVGTHRAGEGQLLVGDVDRDHLAAHGLRVLHGDVAEPADPGDHHGVAGLGVGLLQALVDGDAGTEDRCRHLEVETVRQVADIVGVRQHVFGEAAVHRIAGVLLGVAQGLPARQAVLAVAAGGVQPGHPDPVALLDRRDAGAECGDGADALVARDEGRRGLDRPVAVRGVQVGVAHARGHDLDQDLARARLGHRHRLDRQRLLELVHHRRLHGLRHSNLPRLTLAILAAVPTCRPAGCHSRSCRRLPG